MTFVDTHTHLFLDSFQNDIDTVIKRALEAGVSTMLLPNIDSSSIPPMFEMVRAYPDICYPMMGLHPTSVKENYNQELDIVEKFLFDEKHSFVAVGEIGIDLYWDTTFFTEQKEAFIAQIKWAKQLDLPVVIHARDSFQEIFDVLQKEHLHDVKGVFHSFTGTTKEAAKILEWGFKIGIGGVLTFKNSGLDKVVKEIPLSEIVLETDAPFLAPVPKRGKRNESAYLVYIARKLAEIHQVTPQEVSRITSATSLELFNLQ
ncbi:MAG: TatD family hydrolase [Bacteroidota bacterium]